jgi:hypothetical protein
VRRFTLQPEKNINGIRALHLPAVKDLKTEMPFSSTNFNLIERDFPW